MNFVAFIGCWVAYPLFLVLPLEWSDRLRLLPWMGAYAYARDYAEFCEWRAYRTGRASGEPSDV